MSDKLEEMVGLVDRWQNGAVEASDAGETMEAIALQDCADELSALLPGLREMAAYRDATFDGNAVYAALDDRAKLRTSAENVADVLDALNRVARATGEGEGNG